MACQQTPWLVWASMVELYFIKYDMRVIQVKETYLRFTIHNAGQPWILIAWYIEVFNPSIPSAVLEIL